jgi:hypothetical protein
LPEGFIFGVVIKQEKLSEKDTESEELLERLHFPIKELIESLS